MERAYRDFSFKKSGLLLLIKVNFYNVFLLIWTSVILIKQGA